MSTEQQTFVIVGGGLAGATAAESLRTQGFPGRIVLLCEESERPCNRPPLSKDYLQGKSEKDKIYVHPETWYAEHDVALRLDTRATGLDLAAHQVSVAGGERIGYDKLLLCTGSVARRLSVPGAELEGVFYLRRLEQCEAIKAAFATAGRVAIIGAGWIGLETAAAARAAGCEVTMIERS
jgi:3-phenylpropionate/trans-cinnamate dioxygenase ferredoxin reductase component